LGLGQKPAKVVVKLNFDPIRLAKKFLRDVTEAMGLEIAIDAEISGKTLNIELMGQNLGVLIGKHGQTLDSLQYLTNLAVNKNKENYINIHIDTEGYRDKRKETLEILARNMAKKAKQTKRVVRLEPMSPAERRIIHAALQGDRQITTFSEGQDPHRNVVISLKKEHTQKKDAQARKDREPKGYFMGDKSFAKPGRKIYAGSDE
jgi:spoIIIJ-associated protein